MIGGEVDKLCDLLGVKANHGAGIVAHVFGGEHDGLGGVAYAAHGFVTLLPIAAFVERFDHGDEDVLRLFGGVFPVAFGGFVPCLCVGAKEEEH